MVLGDDLTLCGSVSEDQPIASSLEARTASKMDERLATNYEQGCSTRKDASASTAGTGADGDSSSLPINGPIFDTSEITQKLVYIEVSSVVIAIETGIRLGRYAGALINYAFCVAVVSLAVTTWIRKQDRENTGLLTEKAGNFSDGSTITGVFMCLWWLVGALIMTFKGPFTVTSNGYFAAWAGCWGCVQWTAPFLIKETGQRAAGLRGRSLYLCGITLSSIILAIASIEWIRSPEGIWGITCGGASVCIVVVLGVIYDRLHKELVRGLAALLAIFWIFAAGILTFRGPFLLTGNGFFACWLGLFCSLHYCLIEMRNEEYVD